MLAAFHYWTKEISHMLGRCGMSVAVGMVVGAAVAFFLWSLDQVTELQWQHPGLLWFLPLAGFGVGLLYHFGGKGSDQGTSLLIDEIHRPGAGVPARLAPLVLLGTLVTHLFGGSAGREGTAVQMGGSLAAVLGRWCRLGPAWTRLALMCGVAAGFGAVFGTPLTGAVFAMEVLIMGRLQYEAVVPLLIASMVGDATCTAFGIEHTQYHLAVAAAATSHAPLTASLVGKVAVAAIAFGLAARFFAASTHRVQKSFAKLIPYAPLRPAVGALIVIALVHVLGTRDYLGLGVEAPPGGSVSIVASFEAGGATALSWWWKSLFTAITLGSGFKGGEVTPLFFIGSALGHTLGGLLNEPIALFAALGFISVFAGAANTPLACTIMGMELFGGHYAVYFALACFIAYHVSGHSGIYGAQRIGVAKRLFSPDIEGKSLRQLK